MKRIIEDDTLNDFMGDMYHAASILDMIAPNIRNAETENAIYGVSSLLRFSADNLGRIADASEEYKDNIPDSNEE